MPLEKSKAGLIIIGASEFPESNNFASDTAFLAAKERVKNYFIDTQNLALDESLMLDLFDSSLDVNPMDKKITAFIENLKLKNIPDLFIYYVGHGSFTPNGDLFYLATRTTRDDNPEVSSITFKSLAGTISRRAFNIRTFIILDCCFSGAAGYEFQTDVNEVVERQVRESFPAKGVALLCATSKDKPALIVKDRNITMFSEGLDLALRKGDPSIGSKYLSLRQIHHLTHSYIKELNPGRDVRPEVISPFQPLGDIADMPQFFNHGFFESKMDIVVKKIEIEEEMIRNNIIGVSRLFIDYVRNFDLIETYYEESIIIGAECFDLEEEKLTISQGDKNSLSKDEYRTRRKVIYLRILEIIRLILKQKPNLN